MTTETIERTPLDEACWQAQGGSGDLVVNRYPPGTPAYTQFEAGKALGEAWHMGRCAGELFSPMLEDEQIIQHIQHYGTAKPKAVLKAYREGYRAGQEYPCDDERYSPIVGRVVFMGELYQDVYEDMRGKPRTYEAPTKAAALDQAEQMYRQHEGLAILVDTIYRTLSHGCAEDELTIPGGIVVRVASGADMNNDIRRVCVDHVDPYWDVIPWYPVPGARDDKQRWDAGWFIYAPSIRITEPT